MQRDNLLLAKLRSKWCEARTTDFEQLSLLSDLSKQYWLQGSFRTKSDLDLTAEEYAFIHTLVVHVYELDGKDSRWIYGMFDCNLGICPETVERLFNSISEKMAYTGGNVSYLTKITLHWLISSG